jgi:hypothetical protein
MVISTDKNQKVENLTWLQCQIPRTEWQALNKRRLALNLRWADIIVPGVKDYIAKLEAKAKDAGAEAQATPTMENFEPKSSKSSKSMRAKKGAKS